MLNLVLLVTSIAAILPTNGECYSSSESLVHGCLLQAQARVTPLRWPSLMMSDSPIAISAVLCWWEMISMASVSAKPTQFSFPVCRSYPAVTATFLLTILC